MIPAGLAVFLCANVCYFTWRREDEPDHVRRTLAFFLGLPTTFLTFLLVESDPERAWRRQLRADASDSDPARMRAELERELARVRRFERGKTEPE